MNYILKVENIWVILVNDGMETSREKATFH